MKLRLALAFVVGFGLAYAWQHKPAEVPQPKPDCGQPVKAGPQLKDNLYWVPWPALRDT